MSDLFDDLENALLNTANVSLKQSLKDIGLDEEERDKIIHNVTSSTLSDLNVDYSQFSNHIFFGSAYAAVNFALSRLIRDYPTDGELKDKNEWRKNNTGYENWFFDNYPKQQGYAYFSSGSTGYVVVDDFEKKINFTSGSALSSFTIETVVNSNIADNSINPILSLSHPTDSTNFILFSLRGISSGKPKLLSFYYRSGAVNFELTSSLTDYASQSMHVAVTYNKDNDFCELYVNGLPTDKMSCVGLTGTMNSSARINIGFTNVIGTDYYFSGAMDDLRIWTSARSAELIKRNYYRPIHANHSGSLKLYYKFNQPEEYGTKIIDWSGQGLHGFLTGAVPTYTSSIRSGTLGAWFRDPGDPILALNNTGVVDFVETQRTSGSNYDDENQSMIFKLVPESFVDEENTEYQQLFLLLTARHFDRLKLYIEHLSNILKLKTQKYNGTPSNLLDLAAKHYGFNIGGVYAGSDPLQYFFGENILSSGSLDSSIETIKTQLKRNILSNLSYILKTKSTQESLKATLRTIGLGDVVTISEYTDFSGGIQTTFSPTTVERRVANFPTGSNIYFSGITPGSYDSTVQMRVLFNTASVVQTQGLFNVYDSTNTWKVSVYATRTNLTSSAGIITLSYDGGAQSTESLPLWDNKWINISYRNHTAEERKSLYVSSMDRSGIIFTSSFDVSHPENLGVAPCVITFGSEGSAYFDGKMQELRFWNDIEGPNVNSGDIDNFWSRAKERHYRWGHDWELLELTNLRDQWDNLQFHLKLDDQFSSSSGNVHDYANNSSSGSYTGFSNDVNFNSPGIYIDKFNINHTYDLNVDNDKIRIREGSNFTDNDANVDIPFVSIDFSPVISLNKEIVKWVGDMTKFSNLAGDTLSQYREENYDLDFVRQQFFANRVNDRIDFSAFRSMIRWFDSNFTYLLQQLIPLDVASSISNYVVEPHILEFNKVKRTVGLGSAGQSTTLEATINTQSAITASSNGQSLGLADPGRYGAFVSASAMVTEDAYIDYEATSGSGINYSRLEERRVLDAAFAENTEHYSPTGYGNGFYSQNITGSNYLKNTLNVVTNFAVSGIYYPSSGNKGTNYLSSSHGQPTTTLTSTFNGIQDARWLWMATANNLVDENLMYYKLNYGIGYGGLWGQLRSRNFSSFQGKPLYPVGSTDGIDKTWVGETAVQQNSSFTDYIKIFNNDALKTVMLWPTEKSYDGVELIVAATDTTASFNNNTRAAVFGDVIDIEDYNTLNCEILVRSGKMETSSPIFGFEVKFQFFSKDTPGDKMFETILSASREDASYKQITVPVTYELTTPEIEKNQPINFNLQFERSLPKQKFMRIFITPKMGNGSIGTYYVIVKGTLAKHVRTEDVLPIRSI